MGLKPEHHTELNKVSGIPQKRYEELRAQYRNDSAALQQIDVYDPNTEYHLHFRKLRDAYIENDEKTIEQEEAWFQEHYPDI